MATKFVPIGISMLDGVPIGIYVDPMTSPTGQHGESQMFLIHDAKGSREQIWAAQEDFGEGPVWEFHVYGIFRNGDARTVPSLRMACDLLGVDPAPIREACQPLWAA